MARKIKIVFKVPQHRLMRGVYKIAFGGKFYIGRALILADRAKQHERAINGIMSDYAASQNLSYRDSYAKNWPSYWRIAKYLLENPKIESGTIELIQRCVTPHQMYAAELKILRTLLGNSDCWNRQFSSPRPRPTAVDEWDVKKVGSVFYYYDPANPNKLFPHCYNINAEGEMSKPKR